MAVAAYFCYSGSQSALPVELDKVIHCIYIGKRRIGEEAKFVKNKIESFSKKLWFMGIGQHPYTIGKELTWKSYTLPPAS